jgi:phage anti-repressor protein
MDKITQTKTTWREPDMAAYGGMDDSWVLDCGDEQFPVDARRLHGALGSREDFSTWIRNGIDAGGFAEYEDYCLLDDIVERTGRGGSDRQDYRLTARMAMHLCQMEQTPQGAGVRDCFTVRDERLARVDARTEIPESIVGIEVPLTRAEALRMFLEFSLEDGREAAMAVPRGQSKEEGREADAARGELDGRTWALEIAGCRDLRALEAATNDFWQNLELDMEPGFELADALAIELKRRFGEETTRDEMLMELFPSPETCNSTAYLAGFVASAMRVWEEAKS